ncbi:PAS sensor protein [Halorubrum sp. 48-1-W]|uniref:PAS domain-containing sensor histidine kinase n=1 Tax=Halorubrum sp. 48-1-W TaxID=2249761 RepID=UPI000DCEF1A0|nr:PAS domain S-box protein [Halorubrum sp. 48-1-W]RAW45090.1 PAS sensor protein [Halorubrum sp. 48-1-W]
MTGPPDAATLLDLTRETVAVTDGEGVFSYLNAAAGNLLGFDRDDLVGQNVFELVHPDDEPRFRTVFADVVDGGVSPREPSELRYGTAHGDWLWVQVDLYPPEETGIDGYVLSLRDVTEEVESIRRLETIVSKSPDVLWMFDADWSELLFVNGSIADVFGLTAGELRVHPRRFLEVVYPGDRPFVERAMARLSAGETVRIDYRVVPSEGEIKWLRVPGEPVYADDGDEIVAVVGFARDVTDEYRRNRQLTVMDNLLRHTVRNDMNVVMGTAARIADRTTGRPAADAETIRGVAEELLETAEKQRDVIDLLGRGGSPGPTAVEPIVRDAVDAVRAEEPTGELSVSCPADPVVLAIDDLEYAVVELVENAVDHAESTPVVHVEVDVSDDTVEIAVRDNCPPIPAEQRRVITDEWEMDHLRHTVGMGLWLVYWVADRSGGELAFDRHPDGNVVSLSLPRASATALDDAPVADDVGRDGITAGSGTPRTSGNVTDGGNVADGGDVVDDRETAADGSGPGSGRERDSGGGVAPE